MQFTSTLVASAALALSAFVLSVSATDYRELVKHSSEDGDKFCDSWRCACINYKPLSDKVSFLGTICEVGDYKGKNTKTEAKAACIYSDTNKKAVVYTHQIAKKVGATIVSN